MDNITEEDYIFGKCTADEYIAQSKNSKSDDAAYFLTMAVTMSGMEYGPYTKEIKRCEDIAKRLDEKIFNSYREYNPEI